MKTAPEKTVRRRSSTRAHLVTAAEAVFNETGSMAVSVEAIVSEAGFTRGAFYSNFASITDLFYAVYEKQTGEVEAALRAMLEEVRDAETLDLNDVVHSVVSGLPPEEKWYAIRTALGAAARHDPTISSRLRAHTDAFHDAFEPLLVDALKRAGRVPTVDPALFTRVVVAAHVGAVGQGMLYNEGYELRVAAVRGCLLGLSHPIARAE